MRVVLDTNILIRALPKARGSAREVLQTITSGNHVLITSDFLLQEVARVLAYPRIEKRWKLHPREVEQYLQILGTISEIVKPYPGAPLIRADVKDDPIVYTAVAGKASVLCTLDAHFHEESVELFCKQKGIAIMDDVELLRLLRSERE
jgi:putative PIN family toxin of toxin-antitoxin system